jgi:hypothetical protein
MRVGGGRGCAAFSYYLIPYPPLPPSSLTPGTHEDAALWNSLPYISSVTWIGTHNHNVKLKEDSILKVLKGIIHDYDEFKNEADYATSCTMTDTEKVRQNDLSCITIYRLYIGYVCAGVLRVLPLSSCSLSPTTTALLHDCRRIS